ncbi:MAG: TIM barrel protein [Nitrospiraceae bacterium]|nr:TIM barrel protein [Nitrospiraceae bacterium]
MGVARDTGCAGLDVTAAQASSSITSEASPGIRIAVVNTTWNLGEREGIASSMRLAQEIDARAVQIYCCLREGDSPPEARAAFVDAVKRALAGIAEGPGVPTLLLENELAPAPGFCASLDAWLEILRAVDSPRFRGALDAANFVASGDPGAIGRIVAEAGDLVGHVHAKGVVPFAHDLHVREPFRRRWSGAGEWLAAPAGEGLPDWQSLLPELIENGYRGDITVEPFREKEVIASAVQHIQEILSRFQ